MQRQRTQDLLLVPSPPGFAVPSTGVERGQLPPPVPSPRSGEGAPKGRMRSLSRWQRWLPACRSNCRGAATFSPSVVRAAARWLSLPQGRERTNGFIHSFSMTQTTSQTSAGNQTRLPGAEQLIDLFQLINAGGARSAVGEDYGAELAGRASSFCDRLAAKPPAPAGGQG